MTALQVANNKIKDLKTQVSNLHTKSSDGNETLKQNVINLQNEVMRLNKVNEQLQKSLKQQENMEKQAALLLPLQELNKELKKENSQLRNDVEKLTDQLETMRNQLKKTCETSDKPSSANIFKKPMSRRVKSGKKPGGQAGHKGHTLSHFPNTTTIDCHIQEKCDCGGIVRVSDKFKSKQLVDIQVVLNVTEEHARVGYCAKCGKKHEGTFSDKFVNSVNYGDDLKAIISLLNTRMNLPVNKISELIRILTDSRIHISDGTVVNTVSGLANKSARTVNLIAEYLKSCGLLLVDETGCRVNGKLDWFQIFTNGKFILFSHNKKRGSLLFEGEDLLSIFTGILLHDHFKSYYRYKHLSHAECNDHIDRRLKAVNEILKHGWALQMRSFFFDADKRKKELMANGEYFTEEEIKDYFAKFLEILDMGDAEYMQAIAGKKRIVSYNEEKCLLKRLRAYVNEHLRYITVPEVPRGNVEAERGAKEAKRKVRVSSGFRSDKGADNYARVTSVVSTMSKHKMDVFQGIKDILNDIPIDFKSPSIESS